MKVFTIRYAGIVLEKQITVFAKDVNQIQHLIKLSGQYVLEVLECNEQKLWELDKPENYCIHGIFISEINPCPHGIKI